MKEQLCAGVLIVGLCAASAHGAQAGALADRLGGNALQSLRAPDRPFDSFTPPPAPDYSLAQSWAARPERPGTSAIHPEGTALIDPKKAPVDVFFIHPTSFMSSDAWNAAITDEPTNERTDSGSIRNQASVFNGCCAIFAPRYRQATVGGFFTRQKTERNKALDLAYRDVLAAFDSYMAHDNAGRPFIIASHSQGSWHAVRLLQDRIDHTPARARFVAAYIIGNAIAEDVFSRDYTTIKPCQTATDTGCVISWSSYAEGANAAWTRDHTERLYGDKYESNAGKRILCTNPLTWTTNTEQAPASLNLGAWAFPKSGHSAPAPKAGYTGARCDNGALFTDQAAQAMAETPLSRMKNEHVLDYQLFYMNIRANADARVKAFLAR